MSNLQRDKKALGLLKFHGLEIIPECHQVLVNNKEVIFTGKEFQILMLLAKNRDCVFSKEQIYDRVWNNEYVYDSRNMIKKIEPNPTRPRYILIVWGVGYKFNSAL